MLSINNSRTIFIQTQVNKRRYRRKKAKHHKNTIDKQTIIDTLLKSGKLIDHISPSEIEPKWLKLYTIYEYCIYIKVYILHNIIYDDKLVYWENQQELENLLIELNALEEKTLNCLVNFLQIIAKFMIRKRFWGWSKYKEYLYAEILLTLYESLQKIKFDKNKAKPSVYFGNICWFKGIRIIREIQDEINKQEKNCFEHSNSNLTIINDNNNNIKQIVNNNIDLTFEDIYNLNLDTERLYNISKSIYKNVFLENEENEKLNQQILEIEDEQEKQSDCQYKTIINKIKHIVKIYDDKKLFENINLLREAIKNIELTPQEKKKIKKILEK